MASITQRAFYGCEALTDITFGSSVTSIGSSAFAGCAFTSITIPDNVTKIESSAFIQCRSLGTVTIPNSVTSIGSAAFKWCSKLSDFYSYAIDVPEVSGNPFYESNIAHARLHVPASSVEAYKGTFPWSDFFDVVAMTAMTAYIDGIYYDLSGTKATVKSRNNKYSGDVVIPSSIAYDGKTYNVTSIGGYAFYGCTGLTSIEIPSSVTSIGQSAFSVCTGLTEITSLATMPPTLVENVFSGIDKSLCTLKVPKVSIELYKAADQWKDFNNIEAIETVSGDANGDGKVNITDAVAVVDYILGNAPEGFDAEAADVNHDDQVNITDAVGVVDIILNEGK